MATSASLMEQSESGPTEPTQPNRRPSPAKLPGIVCRTVEGIENQGAAESRPDQAHAGDAPQRWWTASRPPSALTQTDGSWERLTAARMSVAGLVQPKGLALRLCSAM